MKPFINNAVCFCPATPETNREGKNCRHSHPISLHRGPSLTYFWLLAFWRHGGVHASSSRFHWRIWQLCRMGLERFWFCWTWLGNFTHSEDSRGRYLSFQARETKMKKYYKTSQINQPYKISIDGKAISLGSPRFLWNKAICKDLGPVEHNKLLKAMQCNSNFEGKSRYFRSIGQQALPIFVEAGHMIT